MADSPPSIFVRLMRVLDQIAQHSIYSSLIKMTLIFLLALYPFVFIGNEKENVNIEGEGGKVNSTDSIGSESFGYFDFYTWGIVGFLIAFTINRYFLYNSFAMLLTATFFFVAFGVVRFLAHHVLAGSNFFLYVFCLSQLANLLIGPVIKFFEELENMEQIMTSFLGWSRSIFLATSLASYSFNFAFLFLTHEEKSLWLDILYTLILVVHCKRIFKIDSLIGRFAHGREEYETRKFEKYQEKAEGNCEMVMSMERENNSLFNFRIELANTITLLYITLIEVFLTPKDYSKLVFIGLFSFESSHSMALFALVHGVSVFLSTIIVEILQPFAFISRLKLVILAFLGHFSIYLIAYFNYDKFTFEGLALSHENFPLSITLTILISIFTSILHYQQFYYSSNLQYGSKNVFIQLLNEFLWIPMIYLKMHVGKMEQFSTFILIGLMAFVALYFCETMAQQHFHMKGTRRGHVNVGRDVEMFEFGENRTGWGNA